jgi:GH15 family glucan-1,4-alpha-glucosidase
VHTEDRAYAGDTLVLATTLASAKSAVRVLDFFAMREGGAADPRREVVRLIECVRGVAEVTVEVTPRFDYGQVTPWLRRVAANGFAAIGGDDCLLIWAGSEIEADDDRLRVRERLHNGERLSLLMRFVRPHLLAGEPLAGPAPEEIDTRLEETLRWWEKWRERVRRGGHGPEWAGVARSALTLKALTYAPSGAMVAAATSSLPEVSGGERNWDYRYSWIRDSSLAAHALTELGCANEADRFRQFIVTSSAGRAEDLQILFGVGGERRISEGQLDLSGYQDARPVRVGNEAVDQLQLDVFGEVLNLAWRWHRRGRSPDDEEWRFFADLVETAIERWPEPDRGIWEWRGGPRHFVHSKAACWAAVDRGLRLSEECMRRAPVRRWRKARDEIRETIEDRGYDSRRGVFVQCFDAKDLDAALLLLPLAGFVSYDDERMIRTTDAVREELAHGAFLRRYDDDGLPGQEGGFLPCSFWLSECLAHQGRVQQARDVFDRAMSAANPVGLFSEEVDPTTGELLGNYPQALTHLSHIAAAIAIDEFSRRANVAERQSPLPAMDGSA